MILLFGKKTLKVMEQELCNKLFSNLYEHKIIFHERVTLLCELLSYDFTDNILTVTFKVIEPVVKVQPYLNHFYENLKQKGQVNVRVKIPSDLNRIDIERRKLVAYSSFSIWTNFELVKEIIELKNENKEQEIFDKLWE